MNDPKFHLALGKRELISSLIQQVTLARGANGTELGVRTIISRAMWRLWWVALGHDPECEPTERSTGPGCRRVYGSETVVVESEEYFSYSFKL